MKITKAIWPEFESWLLYDQKFSNKPSARSANKSRFNRVTAFFEDKEFTRTNLNLLVGQLVDDNKSPATINNLIKICKNLGAYFNISDFKDYKLFREQRTPVREILTPDEIVMLANYNYPYKRNRQFLNKRQQVLVMILGTTGCRINEALELKWTDLYQSPFRVQFRDTKNNTDREVPLSEKVYRLLENLPKVSERVFESSRGVHLQSQEINSDLKRRAVACGINKRIYNHLFRHSYITTMLEGGVPIEDVQHVVGHKEISTTVRYKNSQLSHYVKTIHMHPLNREEIPWDFLTKQVKESVLKLIDPASHRFTVSQDHGSITIRIENGHGINSSNIRSGITRSSNVSSEKGQ